MFADVRLGGFLGSVLDEGTMFAPHNIESKEDMIEYFRRTSPHPPIPSVELINRILLALAFRRDRLFGISILQAYNFLQHTKREKGARNLRVLVRPLPLFPLLPITHILPAVGEGLAQR